MRTFTCGAIMLAAVALSAPFGEAAFAQAGSTGGTLGNTDKSISGDRREEPAAPKSQTPHRSASAPAEAKSKSAGCGNAVGAYKWAVGTTVINADGTATNGVNQGKWTCAGGQVTITWISGHVDHLTPTAGGYSVMDNMVGQFNAVRM
jgi:hypothetical protein